MNKITFTPQSAAKILYNNKSIQAGATFGCSFYKRTTGELRTGSFRIGVVKHLKGGKLTYDPKKKGLFICYDMNKGYRAIPLENIVEITIDGEKLKP